MTLAGLDEKAHLRAETAEQTNDGVRFVLNGETFDVALHGLHNIGNILLAIAVADHLGVSRQRTKELLKNFHPLSHTFHVRTENGILLLDDTYNSSRLSIRAALHWAKQKSERPRVLLLSDLLETGTQADAFLEELGQLAASSVERVVLTSDRPRKAFERGFKKTIEVLSNETANVNPNSLLLAVGRMPLSSIQKLLPR